MDVILVTLLLSLNLLYRFLYSFYCWLWTEKYFLGSLEIYHSLSLLLKSTLNFWLKQNQTFTAQKMKFCIEDFFSKCDQLCSFLRIWSHLLKKSLMENFIFCTVLACNKQYLNKNFYSKMLFKEKQQSVFQRNCSKTLPKIILTKTCIGNF